MLLLNRIMNKQSLDVNNPIEMLAIKQCKFSKSYFEFLDIRQGAADWNCIFFVIFERHGFRILLIFFFSLLYACTELVTNIWKEKRLMAGVK